MMIPDHVIKPTSQDSTEINDLLLKLSDAIQRCSLDPGLANDFDHWAETIFGPVTGYGKAIDIEPVPQAFMVVDTTTPGF